MLHTDPFMNKFFYYQDLLASWLYTPAYYFFDEFLSAYLTTTEEMEKPYQRFFHYFIIGPIALFLGLASLLPALLGLVFGSTVESFRRPYKYRTSGSWKSTTSYLKSTYSFCTANLCLAPETICRLNNLRYNTRRAKHIGEVLSDESSQIRVNVLRKNNAQQANDCTSEGQDNLMKEDLQYNHDILTNFPNLDFVMIQEAFDKNCTRLLTDELLKLYPYVICDVTENSFQSNMHSFNSGLAFASKYPILDVDFKWYEDSWSQCWFVCKGLLMVKVLLGKRGDKNIVGYIAGTHLQSYQNEKNIIPKQLDNMVEWMDMFRTSTNSSNDVVAFEVVCGDFNFDNMSPGDQEAASHRIFDTYVDLGRERVGKDYDWTVGTEMRPLLMHDFTKENRVEFCKDCLLNPRSRQYYVNNADLTQQSHKAIAQTLVSSHIDEHFDIIDEGGRRRIDYVLFKNSSMLKPVAYNIVTQLAGLTDHLPVSLTLEVDMKKITGTGDA